MKTHLSKKTSGFILTTILLCLATFTFANTETKDWYGNQHFDFELNEEHLTVNINKNPWESFTMTIDHRQLMMNPVVQLEVASDRDMVLRVDISDGIFMSSNKVVIENNVEGNGMFYRLDYDFSDVLSEIELTDNAYLIFYVDPGKKFNGNIAVKKVNFTTPQVTEKSSEINEDAIDSFSVYPSPAKDYTNITIPGNGYHTIRLLSDSGKEVLTADVASFAGLTYMLELNTLNRGYYLVQLISDSRVLTEKLIVN